MFKRVFVIINNRSIKALVLVWISHDENQDGVFTEVACKKRVLAVINFL